MTSPLAKFLAGVWIVLVSMALMAVGKKPVEEIRGPYPVYMTDSLCGKRGCGRPLVFTPKPGYATDTEKKIIALAQDAANKTIQSDCFRQFMLSQHMNSTNGRTPEQVTDHLQGLGGEILVIMYYRSLDRTSALASAYVGGRKTPNGIVHEVRLNSAYFNSSQDACRWAATLGGHEGLGHSLGGYGHGYKWSREREDTVPYLLAGRKHEYGGDVFTACCE